MSNSMQECSTRTQKLCVRRRGKRSTLESQLRVLQLQLQRLEISNTQLQYKQQVLSAVCDCTQQLLHILRINGPCLEGPLHTGLSSSTQAALLQLEGHVRRLIGDKPVAFDGPLEAEQQLVPASCQASCLSDLFSASTANGGCLAIVQHALSTIAASPEEFACWSHAPAPEYRDAIQQLADDLSRMIVPCTEPGPERSSGSSSSSSGSNGKGTNPSAAGGPPVAPTRDGDPTITSDDAPLQLLTPDTTCLAPGVTVTDLAQRLLRFAAVSVAVSVLQPSAAFAVMRSAQLQQPSDAFFRAQALALQLTQAQIDSIAAAVAVHKPLQEALLTEQEVLMAQVEALLQIHARQQQQQQQEECGGAACSDCRHSALEQEGAVSSPSAQGGQGIVTSSDLRAARSRPLSAAGAAAAAAAAAAGIADGVSHLNPADHSVLRALCRRLDAAAHKLAYLAVCGAGHLPGCLTLHQAALFVINIQPYPTIFQPFAHWLAAAVAKGEGRDLAVDAPPLPEPAASAERAGSLACTPAASPAAAAAAAPAAAAPAAGGGVAAAAAAACSRPITRSMGCQPEGSEGSRPCAQHHMQAPGGGAVSPAAAPILLQDREGQRAQQQQQQQQQEKQVAGMQHPLIHSPSSSVRDLQQGSLSAPRSTGSIPSPGGSSMVPGPTMAQLPAAVAVVQQQEQQPVNVSGQLPPQGSRMAPGHPMAQQHRATRQLRGPLGPPLGYLRAASQHGHLQHQQLPQRQQQQQQTLTPLQQQQLQQQQQRLYHWPPALPSPQGSGWQGQQSVGWATPHIQHGWQHPQQHQQHQQQQHQQQQGWSYGTMDNTWQQQAAVVLPPESPTAAPKAMFRPVPYTALHGGHSMGPPPPAAPPVPFTGSHGSQFAALPSAALAAMVTSAPGSQSSGPSSEAAAATAAAPLMDPVSAAGPLPDGDVEVWEEILSLLAEEEVDELLRIDQ